MAHIQAQAQAEPLIGYGAETNEERLNRYLNNILGLINLHPTSPKTSFYYKPLIIEGLLNIIKRPYYNVNNIKFMLLNEAFKNINNNRYIIFYLQYNNNEYLINIDKRFNKITIKKADYKIYRQTAGERNRTKNTYLYLRSGGAYFIEHQLKYLYNNNYIIDAIKYGIIDHTNEEGATAEGLPLNGAGVEYVSRSENLKRGFNKKRALKRELKELQDKEERTPEDILRLNKLINILNI